MMMRSVCAAAAVLLISVAVSARADDAAGKAVYESRCAFCHGPAGKGDGPAGMALTPPPTNFSQAKYWETANLAGLKQVIRNGKAGTAMVPFGPSLSEAEIDQVLAYLQSFAKK